MVTSIDYCRWFHQSQETLHKVTDLSDMINHVTQLQSDRIDLVTQLQSDRIDLVTQLQRDRIDLVTNKRSSRNCDKRGTTSFLDE